jgi:dipeptidyl aminopeptidase/acylaminoacyl peptidase
MKHRIRLSTALVLLVLATLFISPVAHASEAPQATVNTAALNVREGPGTNYGVVTVAHPEDTLQITGRNGTGDWYQVSLADGRRGWVSRSLVTVTGSTSSISEVAAPAASAGGTQSQGHIIVFQVSSGGPIYAMNPDGSNLRYLTTGMDPAISPDGQWVAFTRWDGQQNGITGSLWVINVDGSRERQVMSGAYQPKSPTWSPDGQKILINMQHGGTVDDTWMCMIDRKPVEAPQPIEGQRCMPQRANPYWGLRQVDVSSGAYEDIQNDVHSFGPTWDPVNAWHVIYRGDRGLTSLDLNLGTTWLVKANGAHRGPTFSPDGTKIATTYKQNVQWEVHVMNVDGSGEVRLTETPMSIITEQHLKGLEARAWNNAAPTWSPDGSQIAFITDRNGSYEIWVMNADGSNQHPILSASALGGLKIQYDGVDERVISWR